MQHHAKYEASSSNGSKVMAFNMFLKIFIGDCFSSDLGIRFAFFQQKIPKKRYKGFFFTFGVSKSVSVWGI